MGSAWSVESVAQSEAHCSEAPSSGTHGAELTPGEAETLLVDLAAVFLGDSAPVRRFSPYQQGRRRTTPQRLRHLPGPGRTDSRRRFHGPPRPWHRRSLRESADSGVRWAFPRQNGWKIRFAGTSRFIPTTNNGGASRRPICFSPARRCVSAYRVMARDGRVVWFHCEAKMIRRADGRPWFIHGVGFDITELKRTEEALQEERNVVSAILHTVGALVVVLDPEGRIVRFNRACEQTAGYSFAEVKGKYFWDLCVIPEEAERFKIIVEQLRMDHNAKDYETSLGDARWRSTVDCVVQYSLTGRRWHAGLHHRDGHRHYRAQTAGECDLGNQRRRAAADWPGPARWPGPASDRHRLHEQGAGTKVGREGIDGGGGSGQDRQAGQ